ncbi:MAG: hypothetical protein IPJ94_23495 [Chloroflexi bacterium]|nr:hypothetical protein [Chloroflexota bacterium]
MKYQQILYSRSLSEDYRWLILPANISSPSLNRLKQFYDLFDIKKKQITNEPLTTIYCLNFINTTYLICCLRSNHKDSHGREIYCLQGISIDQVYRRHFWFVLPWLLTNHIQILDIWQHIDFDGADRLNQYQSQTYELSLSKVDFGAVNFLSNLTEQEGKISKKAPVQITFDTQGFDELVSLIASPTFPLSNFAFGATIEMLDYFQFAIFAPIHAEYSATNQFEQYTISSEVAGNIKVFSEPESESIAMQKRVLGLGQTTVDEQPDPLDRFNPRLREVSQKKRDDPKNIKSSRKFWFSLPSVILTKLSGTDVSEETED